MNLSITNSTKGNYKKSYEVIKQRTELELVAHKYSSRTLKEKAELTSMFLRQTS